jgi:hypothetical protein
VVYGGLYHFNPSEQGLLYLPLLAGSLLAECGTGRMGDKVVASDFSCPLGIPAIIERRNAKYATGKRGSDPEITTSTTALCLPEDVQSDSTKVPEMRLVIAFPGILICIVRGLEGLFTDLPPLIRSMQASLLWFGFGVEKHLHWAHLAVASGLGAYGTQMVTSIM